MFSLRALAPAFIGVAVLAPVAAGGTVVWQGSLEALVRAAETFKTGPSAPKPDYWITIDPEATADGLLGVYDRHAEEFWR
ncbi:MAG TPA: hypothetical protein PKK95_12705, partial [Vicinamibacterales bacterium]|nr:hypothetical protein [Vicinamibacterales bacterium]